MKEDRGRRRRRLPGAMRRDAPLSGALPLSFSHPLGTPRTKRHPASSRRALRRARAVSPRRSDVTEEFDDIYGICESNTRRVCEILGTSIARREGRASRRNVTRAPRTWRRRDVDAATSVRGSRRDYSLCDVPLSPLLSKERKDDFD